jgi:hypothetical protein
MPPLLLALEAVPFLIERTALCFLSYAIPDGKPLSTFPGIALGQLPLSIEF